MTLRYHEYAVPTPLHELVQRVWSLRGDDDAAAAEPIIADGSVELIFNLGAPIEEHRGTGAASRQPTAAVIGPTIHPIFIRPTAGLDVVGVRIRPSAVGAFFGINAGEFRDGTFVLEDAVPRTRGLADHLADIGERDRVLTLIHWLSRRPPARLDHRLTTAMSALRGGSLQRVAAVCRAADIGERTLERLCRAHVGLSAKELLRLTRLHRVLTLAAREPALTWSMIAARCGYADQSHFVRDFRELAAMTPSEYRARSGTLTDTVVQQEHGD